MLSRTRSLVPKSWPTAALRYSSTTSRHGKTDVHKISTRYVNPMKLFNEWYGEHLNGHENEAIYKVCCVSTAYKNGDVSSRSLQLRRLDDDGFVILTDNRSLKSKNIKENPQAAVVFLWSKTVSDELLTRQVRVHGVVQQLSTIETDELFVNEPLFAKIRAHICRQGTPVVWQELKAKHDELQKKFLIEGEKLPKPNHVVGYKILPNYLEFYEALGQRIGDRLLFSKNDSSWRMSRIAA